ncbi:MAG: cytochrome c [Gammaproteobacteria bacterium]
MKTWAREEIWTSKRDFQVKTDNFVKAAGTLAAAVEGGDQKAILRAAVAVGKTCSACHDEYTR